MKERKLSMQRDITQKDEQRMQQLMAISCIHSVIWHNANNIEINYIREPNEEENKQIQELIK